MNTEIKNKSCTFRILIVESALNTKKMQTVVQQLLANIPDAAQIKQFIFENDADEKMLDEWLFERIYRGKNWEKLEREEIEKAFEVGNSMGICANSHDYFEEVYK